MNLGPPADLGFPPDLFPSWRNFQAEAVQEVHDQLQSRGQVILSAPTGGGKSLIGCAVAKLLGIRALILVGTKQLSYQYEESFPENVVVMKGRGNYPCAIYPHLTADIAPCTVGDKKCAVKFSGGCPYYAAKARALAADIVVTNYAYALNELNYIGKLKSGRPFMILDEAHRVERELMSWVNISINKKLLGKYGVRVPSLKGFTKWRAWATAILPKIYDITTRLAAQAKTFNWDKSFMRDWQRLDRAHKEIKKLSELGETWLEEYRPWSVQFKPVWVSKYAHPYLLGHADKVLLMSATPPFPETLGIRGHGSIEVPSTFPVRNRPFVNVASVKLNRKTLEAQLPKVVSECDHLISKHRAEGHKGVCHTTSYHIRDYILAYSSHQDIMMTHDQKDRSEVLAEFMESEGPRVLVSPSMSEGVSFDDDRARFSIIVKTPFLSLGDPQVRARANENRNWYMHATINSLTQTYGRVVRSPTDWASTYYLDGHLKWLVGRYKGYFQRWFLESIVWGKR